MKTKQIIKTLQAHNDWRRDKINTTEYFDTITAHEIGLTLDAAIERLQTLEKERDEAVKIAKTAFRAIETICVHAQHCDQCYSFEIVEQCRNELHGFDRLNYLEEGSE
jgi:predicted ATPase